MAVTFMLGALGGLITLGTYQKFGVMISTDNHYFGYVVGSLSSVANAAGRIAWGLLSDRWGTYPTLGLLTLTLSTLLFTWSLSYEPIGSKYAFTAWVMGESLCVRGLGREGGRRGLAGKRLCLGANTPRSAVVIAAVLARYHSEWLGAACGDCALIGGERFYGLAGIC
jgi:MFS family permease